MSKIIKSSRIIGEYRLTDVKIEKKRNNEKPDKTEDRQKQKTEQDEEERQILTEAHKRAEEIIEQAETQAESILKEARQKAEEKQEEIFAEIREQGFEAGKKEGIEKGLQQLQNTHQTLKQVVEKSREELQSEKEKLPAEIIKLATRIAEKIVNVQLDLNPELINNIIYEMLLDIGDNHQKIEIKVNPEVMNFINQAEIASYHAEYDLEFTADSSLNPGDCIVETEYGGKDGSLDRKLKLLEKELYKGAGYHEGA